ncbi:MAG: DegT/DnrJ/EryC1/StrS family aminotransferase [Chloroflexota bacterium]
MSNKNIPFVDLFAQYKSIKSEVDEAMAGVISTSAYVLGPDVKQLELEFAAYCGIGYAIGVDSGTSALELALHGFGIGPGDEVITAANTFIATASAISCVGAKPVLVDVDPVTNNINVDHINTVITNHTKAIIPVHLFGHPADMDPIMEIAKQHSLIVIEDACQAHGAKYKGKRMGSIGHAAAFSFYPSKNLGAYGDGGMIVTNDSNVADKIRMLRNHGEKEKYLHETLGYNRRLDTIQAAVLRVKLKHLDDWNKSRREHAALYNNLLIGSNVITPRVADYAEPVWHLYVIQVKNRDELRTKLSERGISTGIHYPVPIHLQTAYQSLNYKPGDFPVTEESAKQILSLPMYAELEPWMIKYVVDSIKELL